MKEFTFFIAFIFFLIQINAQQMQQVTYQMNSQASMRMKPIETIKLNEKDKIKLRKTVDSLYYIDQSLRMLHMKLDSSYNLPQFSFMKPKKVLENELDENFTQYVKTKDSIWNAMKIHDEKNTRKLLTLTKIFGFPNNKRLGTYKSKAYLIFVHSPQKYYEEIKKTVFEEHQKGRITDYKAAFIYWHIEGRNGPPPLADQYGRLIEN